MNQRESVYRPPFAVVSACACLIAVGGVALLTGIYQTPHRVFPNLLVESYFFLSLGLGGSVFVALQYVTAAGWSVAFRRVPEAMAATLPAAALFIFLVLVASPSLYYWTAPRTDVAEAANQLHDDWFQRWFFLVRSAVYLISWLILSWALVRNSRLQDQDHELSHTRKNVRFSAAFLTIFAISFWLASSDWLMSLEPDWSSTIFGLYQFAGLFLGGLAGIIVLANCLRWLGPFRRVLSREHLHDLGKLLFGFSSFWMYVWFCQYLLIWYVNNPEETGWFTRRLNGAWGMLLLVNVILNWGVPFLVLLPKATKQSAVVLTAVALVVLAGHWLDLYLVILPTSGEPDLISAAWEIGLALGAAGLFALLFFAGLARAPLIPVADPYLSESLATHAAADSDGGGTAPDFAWQQPIV
jgi:hypothetical protein